MYVYYYQTLHFYKTVTISYTFGIIMKRTKEKAELTREKLLKVALNVFNRKGYAETRLEDVAKQANVTRGAIYWHFQNKYNLYYTLIKEYTPDVEKQFETILDSDESPVKRIGQCLTHFCENIEDDEEFQALIKLVFLNKSILVESEDILKVISERQRSIMHLISMVIQEGIECGEIRSGIEPDSISILLNCSLAGIAAMWFSKAIEFSPKKKADIFIDNFLNGIVKK